MNYLPYGKIKEYHNISDSALRVWANEGRIRVKRMPGGKRFYFKDDVDAIFGEEGKIPPKKERKRICYARVSSSHQKEDLERQIQEFKDCYPSYEIITDVGSGINYQRKGFKRVLERVVEGDISEIVVMHKDRLCRFGYEILEFIFEKLGIKVVVHSRKFLSSQEEERSFEQELSDDLLSVITVFVAKKNGRRSAENRKRRNEKKLQDEKDKVVSDTN